MSNTYHIMMNDSEKEKDMAETKAREHKERTEAEKKTHTEEKGPSA